MSDGHEGEGLASWVEGGLMFSIRRYIVSTSWILEVHAMHRSHLVLAVLSTGAMGCNLPPGPAVVEIEPAVPTTIDDLSAVIVEESDDPNDDVVTYDYAWSVDGSTVRDITAPEVPAERTSRGERWTVTITPSDGKLSGPAATAFVDILNSVPTVSSATILPTEVREADTMTCAGHGFHDVDDDPEGYRYQWLVDGVDVGTAATLDGTSFDRGQSVVCRLTPFDGRDDGAPVDSGAVVVQNTAPVLSSVVLSHSTPREGDTLAAALTGAFDADGDAITFSYRWLVDGVEVGTAATLSSDAFDKGQVIQVEVIPFDGSDSGMPVKSGLVTAVNTPPVATGVPLSPSSPKTNDDVLATASSLDVDGDTVSFAYAWYVNGSRVTATGDRLSGATYFGKGDLLHVVVTPNDGVDDGADLTSVAVEVVNTVPSIVSATLSPVPAREADVVVCAASGWSDDDLDREGYTYSWTVNGKVGATTDRVDGDDFSKGDKVVCTITPTDGEESGSPVASKVLVISNSAPTIGSVVLSTKSPREGDTLVATIVAAKDVDDDGITFAYSWHVNGKSVSAASRLGSDQFKKLDKVWVVVTPTDGFNAGVGVKSDTAVANTAPVVASIGLTPDPAYTTTHLTAKATASDVDKDTLSYAYTWYVDKVKQVTTTATLDHKSFKKGSAVYVIVTADDGESTASKTSSTRTVSNSTPTTPANPVLSPSSPKVTDNLVCATAGSTDADGDSLTYSYAWYRNGMLYGTYTSTARSHTLSSASTARGQRWYCRVRATDGSATSDWSGDSTGVVVCESGSMAVGHGAAGLVVDWAGPLDSGYDDFTAEMYVYITKASVSDFGYLLASMNTMAYGPLWMEASDLNKLGLSLNTWTHVAVVWDKGKGEIRTYLDGSLRRTKTHSKATIGALALYVGGPTYPYVHRCNCDLAGLRLSSTARYSKAFTPPLTYGGESDTLLMIPMTDVAGGVADVGPHSIKTTKSSNASVGAGGPYCRTK
jgi:hypothetical protein